LGLVNH